MSSNVETSCSFQSQAKGLKILTGDSNSRIGSLPSQPYTFNIIIPYSWPTINAPGSCSTFCLQECPCWNCRWASAILSLVCLYLRQSCWPLYFNGETEDSEFNAATPTYAQNTSIFTLFQHKKWFFLKVSFPTLALPSQELCSLYPPWCHTIKVCIQAARQAEKEMVFKHIGGDFYFYNTTQVEKPWDHWVKSDHQYPPSLLDDSPNTNSSQRPWWHNYFPALTELL